MRELTIDNIRIADDTDCYVIAEIGHNHQGSVKTCKEMFKAAKDCGAHAVKLQKRDNRSLYTKAMFDKSYDNENSYGATYGEHREALEFGEAEYRELKAYAQELNVTFFATAFDFKSADFLAKLDMPAYKIASGDLKNTPLLKHVAKLNKPIIVSTGGGTMADVVRAYEALASVHKHFAILQCTAAYPAKFEELNLGVISTFRKQFPNTVIGLSAHDNGIAMALAAYMLGGRIVEKHFTLNRSSKGTDHAFSLEPVGMRKMVRDLQRARLAIGDGEKRTFETEKSPLIKMGKKLVAAKKLGRGQVLTFNDIAIKSPGDGVPPYELEKFIGKKLKHDLTEDENLTFDGIE